VAVVLTTVQTKQIRINIHNGNNTKNSTLNTKHSKYKYTYYQNTHTVITKTRTCVLHAPPITPFPDGRYSVKSTDHEAALYAAQSNVLLTFFLQSEVQITKLKSPKPAPWFRGGRAPLILSLGTRWRWVAHCTSRSLFSVGKEPPVPTGWDQEPVWNIWRRERISLSLPGMELCIAQPMLPVCCTDWAIAGCMRGANIGF
jgi:hypothetical protein